VDAAAAAVVQPWLERTAAVGGEVLGTATLAVSGKGTPGADCGMSDLLCRAMLHASGAQLALHGTLAEESWTAGAVVDGRALYRAVPYENQLCVVELTPDELKEVVAEQLHNRSSYTYAGIWGAHAEVAADGQTAVALRFPASVAAGERVTLVLTSYHAAGGGNRYPVLRALVRQPAARLRVLPQTTREALRAYLLAVPDWCRPPTPWLRLPGPAARRARASSPSAQPAMPVAGPTPTAPGAP
jgi:2',3'-cyclic-nucleotide 2'-phosphodiesterase (5'-nucleotidase family)